jgi:hypothetical protein
MVVTHVCPFLANRCTGFIGMNEGDALIGTQVPYIVAFAVCLLRHCVVEHGDKYTATPAIMDVVPVFFI